MALLKYFRIEPSIDKQVEFLPKPHGSLSLMMPSSSIAAANVKLKRSQSRIKNKAARAVKESTSTTQKRKRLKLQRRHWSVALYPQFHIMRKLIRSEHFLQALCTPGRPSTFWSWPKDGKRI